MTGKHVPAEALEMALTPNSSLEFGETLNRRILLTVETSPFSHARQNRLTISSPRYVFDICTSDISRAVLLSSYCLHFGYSTSLRNEIDKGKQLLTGAIVD